MHALDTESRLRDLLLEAGVAGARDTNWKHPQPASSADVAQTWEVFQRFAAEPVEASDLDPEGECVSAEYLTVNWFQGEGTLFEVSMSRRFYFLREDGEFDRVALLHCEFQYASTPELTALGSFGLDSFDLALDDFFAQALAAPGFQIEDEPIAIKVWYSDV